MPEMSAMLIFEPAVLSMSATVIGFTCTIQIQQQHSGIVNHSPLDVPDSGVLLPPLRLGRVSPEKA
jgi:hypothetical protein